MPFPIAGTTIYGGWTQRGEQYADLDTRFSSYNTKLSQLACDSVTDDRAALNTLVNSTMQAGGGQLDVVGVVRLASNLTIPANVRLNFMPGAYLAPDIGVTITINGPFNNHLDKKFGGGGLIRFGDGHITPLAAQWWGAVGDGTTDDTIAIKAQVAAACATAVSIGGGATAYFPMADYVLSDTINITDHRVHVLGDGKWATQFVFNPTSAKSCFKFQRTIAGTGTVSAAAGSATFSTSQAGLVANGDILIILLNYYQVSAFNGTTACTLTALSGGGTSFGASGWVTSQPLYQCSFRGASFAGNRGFQKIALDLLDTSEFHVQEMTVGPIGGWTSSERMGAGSITAGLNVLTSANLAFTIADVGKTILVNTAGAGGAALATTISGFTNSTTVTLTANAGTTVSAVQTHVASQAATPSIGIRSKGREMFTVKLVDIAADRPIHVTRNFSAPTLSADHFHFSDVILLPTLGNESCYLIDGDVGLSMLTLDGYQAMVGGKNGLKVASGTAPSNALIANVYNLRMEQPGDLTGFAIDWGMAAINLNVYGSNFGGAGSPTNGGIKLRNVTHTLLSGCEYSGTGAAATALDIDSTCRDLQLIQTFFNDSSVVSMPGFEEIFSLPTGNSLAPLRPNCFWWLSAAGSPAILLNGILTHKLVTTLAVGGQSVNLPMAGSGALKTGQIRMSAYSATGPTRAMGIWHVDGTGAVLVVGTANCNVGNTGGALNVWWQAIGTIGVINNLAQPVKILLEAEWTT